MEKELY